MSATIVSILRRARDLIDTPDKWLKGCWSDGEGRYCVLGAIEAAGGAAQYHKVRNAIADAAGLANGWCVIDWNNAAERTHAEVMDALQRAIAAAEVTL